MMSHSFSPPEDTKGICCSLVLRVTETTLKEVIDSSLGTVQKWEEKKKKEQRGDSLRSCFSVFHSVVATLGRSYHRLRLLNDFKNLNGEIRKPTRVIQLSTGTHPCLRLFTRVRLMVDWLVCRQDNKNCDRQISTILGRRTAQNRSNKLSVRILEFVFLNIFVDFSGNKLWMLMEKKKIRHMYVAGLAGVIQGCQLDCWALAELCSLLTLNTRFNPFWKWDLFGCNS